MIIYVFLRTFSSTMFLIESVNNFVFHHVIHNLVLLFLFLASGLGFGSLGWRVTFRIIRPALKGHSDVTFFNHYKYKQDRSRRCKYIQSIDIENAEKTLACYKGDEKPRTSIKYCKVASITRLRHDGAVLQAL